MKKLLRVTLVLAMVLCLSITAFAAGSTTSVAGIAKAVDSDGNEVQITATDDVCELTADAAAAAIGGVEAKDLTVVFLKDLSSDVLPVTITFSVEGATAKDTVYVLHCADHATGTHAWKVEAKCAGNAVSATFDSLSPVALVLEKGATDNGGTTSPKTGEQMMVLYSGIVIALAGTVAFAAYKKKA